MKKNPILFFIILTITLSGCSSFTVKTDVDQKPGISEIKTSGIILRLAQSSKIEKEDQLKNLSSWLSEYVSSENLVLIPDCTEGLSSFSTIEDRFYQQSIKYRDKGYFGIFWDDDYLTYKSIGVVNNYLKKNEVELKHLISEKSLNGIIIYEIYNIVSLGMQFMDFDSVLVVVDSNLDIMYMDHQTDGYEINEQDIERAKKQMMDRISQRLAEGLQEIDMLGDTKD